MPELSRGGRNKGIYFCGLYSEYKNGSVAHPLFSLYSIPFLIFFSSVFYILSTLKLRPPPSPSRNHPSYPFYTTNTFSFVFMTDQNQPPQDPPPPQQPPSNMGEGKPPKVHYCPAHDQESSALRSCCLLIFIFLLLAGATVLTVWLVYRPHKPRFIVAGAAIYELNATSQPFISTSMQFTIVMRNPNKRVSIFYSKLQAYVSYRNQQITPPVDLPPLYHETKSTVSLSPVLGSGMVPASAEVVNGLMIDETYGVVALKVVLLGKLRWKAGAIRTLKYGFYVRCNVWVGLKKGVAGPVPLLGAPPCKVDI